MIRSECWSRRGPQNERDARQHVSRCRAAHRRVHVAKPGRKAGVGAAVAADHGFSASRPRSVRCQHIRSASGVFSGPQSRCSRPRREPGPDYRTEQVPTQLGDLPHDALDVRLECGEIDALGVRTRKYRRAIVWLADDMPEVFAQLLAAAGDRRGSATGRVGVWRGGWGPNISVAAPFVWRCLTGSTVAPSPHPADLPSVELFVECAISVPRPE